jgi:hypothetical protein
MMVHQAIECVLNDYVLNFWIIEHIQQKGQRDDAQKILPRMQSAS